MAQRPPTAQSQGRAPLLAGRYELLRTQETDANTASILAWDLRLKRWRSVRVARPGDDHAAERLVASAQRAAQLEHPTLERVLDVGRDGPISFVVRDRFVGSVARHLSRRGSVPPAWAIRVVARCAEGLAWAHPRGLLHGHPRPEVVLFAEDGEAVLTRFGQRALLRDDEETRNGAAWAHLAPELRQYWEPTVATEVFALGALLYTLLTGHHSADLHYAEAYEGMLGQVPRSLRPIVLRACAFEPSERHPSAAELQDALLNKLGTLPPADGAAPWLEHTQDFPSRDGFAESDAIIEELAQALGLPPPSAMAAPVDPRSQESTIDPQTPDSPVLPYTVPTPVASPPISSMGPPTSGEPEYLVGSYDAPTYEAPQFETVEDLYGTAQPDYPSTPTATERVSLSKEGDLSARLTRAAANDAPGVLASLLRWGLIALLFGLTFITVSSGVAYLFVQTENRTEYMFVEAALAEEATLSSWTYQDPDLTGLWERFRDAPPDQRATAAADYIEAARARADRAPEMVPPGVDKALRRLEKSRRRWYSANRP